MNFYQELRGRYIAGTDRPSLEEQRVTRALLVQDIVDALDDADNKRMLDEPDCDSLAALDDAAEEHLLRVSADVGQVPVEPSPSRGAIT